ncbi:MAG: hypothetical protein V2A77_00330 [Pseudomonadota bacterium]
MRRQERDLIGLTGLDLDEMDTGRPAFAEKGDAEKTPSVSEDLTLGGRLVAYARLWSATRCFFGTPITDSRATHEHLLEVAGRRVGKAATQSPDSGPLEFDPMEFDLDLPDAARLDMNDLLDRRAANTGPLRGLLARLSSMQALLRAREWSDELRVSLDLLALETKEAAGRVCREAGSFDRRLRLTCAAVPKADPRRLFAVLSGEDEPPDAGEGGLYLLVKDA